MAPARQAATLVDDPLSETVPARSLPPPPAAGSLAPCGNSSSSGMPSPPGTTATCRTTPVPSTPADARPPKPCAPQWSTSASPPTSSSSVPPAAPSKPLKPSNHGPKPPSSSQWTVSISPPPPTLLAALQDAAETVRSILLVGHNPGLHELAMLLVGAHAMTLGNHDMRRLAEGYPSGALAEFSIPGPWRDLDEGAGRLVRFIAPRDLPGG